MEKVACLDDFLVDAFSHMYSIVSIQVNLIRRFVHTQFGKYDAIFYRNPNLDIPLLVREVRSLNIEMNTSSTSNREANPKEGESGALLGARKAVGQQL